MSKQLSPMAKKPKKIRTSFRKNRSGRARQGDLTRRFAADEEQNARCGQRRAG